MGVRTAQRRRADDGLLIEDRHLRRLTARIVTIMLVTFLTIIMLTVLGHSLDGLVGPVPWAWIAGVGLWLLSAVLCEIYIRLTHESTAAGGREDV